MELDAGIHDFVDQLAAIGLDHRDLARRVEAPGVEPGGVVDELAPGLDLGGEHGELLADRLLLPERGAEGRAGADIVDRQLDRGLRLAHRHGADHRALVLEVAHDRVKAAPLAAEQVLGGNPALLENELGRVRGAPAVLVESAADTEARRALLDQEHRDRLRGLARRIGLGRDAVEIGMDAIGDEHLRAVQHV